MDRRNGTKLVQVVVWCKHVKKGIKWNTKFSELGSQSTINDYFSVLSLCTLRRLVLKSNGAMAPPRILLLWSTFIYWNTNTIGITSWLYTKGNKNYSHYQDRERTTKTLRRNKIRQSTKGRDKIWEPVQNEYHKSDLTLNPVWIS